MSIKKTVLMVLVIISIVGIISGGCNSGAKDTTSATAVSPKTWYQEIANELKALQPKDAPDNLWPVDGKKNGTEFDVNTYFTVLTHLAMQERYLLDYVYLGDGSAGGPILYVRPVDAVPFANYTEYKEATHKNPRADNDNSLIWLVQGADTSTFGNKITNDGTKEGYFEYAVLQLIGNKFYLHGFTRVSDKRLVCEDSEVTSIITELEKTATVTLDKKFQEFKKAAHKLDLGPKIDVAEDTVTLTLVTFSNQEGFTRNTLTMLKQYPNLIIDHKIIPLLGYQGED